VPSDDARLRALAFKIAYRMLGSVAEAEDVVQEALLRLHDRPALQNEEAFLTTVTTRLSIDVLRSARVRRETYVGEWLPEPLVADEAPQLAQDADEISLAMLVLLERLAPDERAVFVLREAFDMPFAEIGEIIDASPDACRQRLSRARRRIEKDLPRFDADPAERHALAHSFLRAAREGDFTGLVALLAPDAVLVGDGGGKARSIPAPMVGGQAVARALATFYKLADGAGVTLVPAIVNGQPGFRSLDPQGRIINVVQVDVADGRIQRVHSILNPDKLRHLGLVSDLGLRPSAKTTTPR
jgi:RNA polymerase sigma-70 factor, ECF subfamily